MKALVIGAGRIGSTFDELKEKDWTNTHIGAYLKNARIMEVAVCDKDEIALKRSLDFWHIEKGYCDIDKALKEFKPDVVSLCVKPQQALAILERIVKFKNIKYLWFEKPFSDSLKNAKRQLCLLKRKNIRFVTNYQRRFDPFYIYIRKNLKSLIGRPAKCICFFSGGILNTAPHLVNLLIFYFGIPRSSTAFKIEADPKGDFHGDFRLDFKGLSAYCFELNRQISILSGGYSIFELLILGDKGRIDIKSLPLNEYDFDYYLKTPSRFKGTDILTRRPLKVEFKRDYLERELAVLLVGKKNRPDTEEAVETLKVFKGLGLVT